MNAERTVLKLLLAGLVIWGGSAWAQPNAPTMAAEPEFTVGLSNSVLWSNESASGAVQYFVGAATDSTFPEPQQIALSSGWISGTTYTFQNVLEDGVKYYYRVAARDAGLNMSGWSAPVVFSTQDASGPAPVTDLDAVGRLEYIRLTWSSVEDAGIGLAFYRVYRSTAMGDLGSRIDEGDNTVTLPIFADHAVDQTTTYWYTVRPVDLFGQETLDGNNQDDAAIQLLGDPSLQIVWPTDHYVTCQESIDVNGLFYNTVSIWVNGKPARMTLDPVAGEFSALGIPLAMGPNTILAEGNGTFGRTGSHEILVIRLPSCGPLPVLTITVPEDGSYQELGTVEVSGTVENVGAIMIMDQWVDITWNAEFTTGTFLYPNYPIDQLGATTITATGYGTPPPGELIDRVVTDEVTVYVVAPGELAVAITSPADGDIFTDRSVDVAGTFSGAFMVEVNGMPAVLDPTALTFVCESVPLEPGPNLIRAVATGIDMATVEDVITVYVVGGTPPTIEITFPPDRYVTSEQLIAMTGGSTNTAWIEIGYPGGELIQVLPDVATGAWSAALTLPAPYAAVTITATAYGLDATAQDQVTVYVVGTAAPSIAITYPADGAALNETPVTVTGTAQNIGYVEVNGIPAQYDVPNFQASIALVDGWNTIIARGFGVSEIVADTVTVWYESGCTGDPGSVAITAPADSIVTSASAVTVAGTSRCIRAISVNGSAAAIDFATGAWNVATVPLNIGANPITATGTNYAGGTVTAMITVFRVAGTEPPEIAITSPTAGQEFVFADSMITVQGTSRNLAWVKVNGVVASLNAETGAWSLGGFHLNVGDNVVTAVGYGTQQVTASVTVKRLPDTPPPSAQFHAIITPNGDGYNDVANIPVTSLNSTLTIFARDGQEVATSTVVDQRYSERFMHWDGKDKEGVIVPSGVYIFQVKDNGSTTTGTVVVAR